MNGLTTTFICFRTSFAYLPTALMRQVIRSSVRLLPLYLRNRLTVDLELLCGHSAQGIEGQGHRSRSSFYGSG